MALKQFNGFHEAFDQKNLDKCNKTHWIRVITQINTINSYTAIYQSKTFNSMKSSRIKKRIQFKNLKKILFNVFIISIFFNNYSFAQQKTKDSIYSNVLKEQRDLQIILPKDYDSSNKYDVIYLVDGEWNTDMFSQIYQYASEWDFIPKNIIIVGVENKYIDGVNQRSRDLTPTQVNNQPLTGKADNFITFFKDELIPYINTKLPTTEANTLFGHSHGGTFTVYTFLKEPQLFKSYIAADPSLWWDNRYMSKYAAKRLPELSEVNATLHISGRKGDAYEGMGIVAMDSVLKLKAPKGLFWESIDYPNEIHNSVKLKSIYDGIKFTYSGYTSQNITFHPMGGIIEKGKTFNVFRDIDNTSIHYTTDGSEPSITSPKMGQIIVLNGSTELKAKSISVRSPNNKTTTAHYIEGKAIKPVKKPKKAVAGGLNYSYYEGEWDKLPNFNDLKPVKTGIADNEFNLKNLPSKNNFGCVLKGYFEAKEDGDYIFGISSDDGSKFYLSNKLLLDHDGIHGNNSLKSYMVPLKAGLHPIQLEYFQKDGDSSYMLMYLKPGTLEPLPVSLDLQYYIK